MKIECGRKCWTGLKFRTILKLVMLACFIVVLLSAIDDLWQQRVHIVQDMVLQDIPLPAFTLCPNWPNNELYPVFKGGQNKTLVDFISKVKPMNEYVMGAMMYYGSVMQPRHVVNLSASYSGEIVRPGNDLQLIRCASYNTPVETVKLNAIVEIWFFLNMTELRAVRVERHQNGMSTANNLENWRQIDTVVHDTVLNVHLEVENTRRLRRRAVQCDPENRAKLSFCFDQHFESTLGCSLPWLPRKEGLRICDQPKDMDGLFEIYTSFSEEPEVSYGAVKQNEDCISVNCDSANWKTLSQQDYTRSTNFLEPNMSVAIYTIPPGSSVKIIREELTYGIKDFVADFGGYLGLLLGASLISIYDDIEATISRRFSKP